MLDANKNGLPSSLVKNIFKQIISVVTYLWDVGIVHGDLKEENIIYSASSVKVIDFGSSVCIREGVIDASSFHGTVHVIIFLV